MTEKDYLSVSKENSLEINLENFKKNLEKISSQIDISNDNFQNDKIAFSAQRIMLSNLLILLPVVVQKVIDKPGQGAVYALTNVISQINDLFNQLRSSEDLENQVDYINNEIIGSLLKSLLAEIFDITYYIKQEIKGSVEFVDDIQLQQKIFSYFDKQLKDVAKIIDKKIMESEEKLKNYMLEI